VWFFLFKIKELFLSVHVFRHGYIILQGEIEEGKPFYKGEKKRKRKKEKKKKKMTKKKKIHGFGLLFKKFVYRT